MSKLNGKFHLLTENKKDFLAFLKTRYKLYHRSNVFFRDLHYGVMAYLASKDNSAGYTEAEAITKQMVEAWESEGILKKIDRLAYLLEYPEFKKPSVKPAAPAKPAASAAAKPAASASKPSAQPSKPAVQAGEKEKAVQEKSGDRTKEETTKGQAGTPSPNT